MLEEIGSDSSRLPVVAFHTGEVLVDPSTAEVAEALGARVQTADISECDLLIAGAGLRTSGSNQLVELSDGSPIEARAVILATGVAWRRLRGPRLEALHGAGVFYGASGAEAKAMRGEPVCIVGAGNSAGLAAVNLARYASVVEMLVRGDSLGRSMSEYLIRDIEDTPNIHVRFRTEVVDVGGRGRLERLMVRNRDSDTYEEIATRALFVLIGAEPQTDWLEGTVERDREGFILTGPDILEHSRTPPLWPLRRPPRLFESSRPGVFAVGNVRHGSVKRVASAVGEGAVAVRLAHEYLGEQHRATAHPPPEDRA